MIEQRLHDSENEERRRQFEKLENTARGARIKAAREENRNFQQLTADKMQAKKDEMALQKKLKQMQDRSVAADKARNRELGRSFRLGKDIVVQTTKNARAQRRATKRLKNKMSWRVNKETSGCVALSVAV